MNWYLTHNKKNPRGSGFKTKHKQTKINLKETDEDWGWGFDWKLTWHN